MSVKGVDLKRKGKTEKVFYNLGLFINRVRLAYLEGLNKTHLKIRKLHDVTYQRGGKYKAWSDKPYSSTIHKTAMITFIASFVIFSLAQNIFPNLFNLTIPNNALAGSTQVVWTTKDHFENNGATNSNYTGATTSTDVVISGDNNDVTDSNNNDDITLGNPDINFDTISISEGYNYSLAIKTDGSLWAWGSNSSGQLGLGDTTTRTTPVQVGSSIDWSYIDTDGSLNPSSYGIKTDGTLWAWGENEWRQLGLGDTTDRLVPTQVGTSTNWKRVSAGGSFALAIKTDGTLWAWGSNSSGQLGLGDTTNRLVPTQVGVGVNWDSLDTAEGSSFAIKTDGTLWAWGGNYYGHLGLGDTTNRLVPTQVGSDTDWKIVNTETPNIFGESSFAIKNDGTLWGWGYNYSGSLGLGDTSPRPTPTQIGTDTNWKYVFAGSHAVGIKTDGTLWAWGSNSSGELGLGDTTNRLVPTQVGSDTDWKMISAPRSTTIATKTNNTFWGWGYNAYSQLGLGDTTNRLVPTQVGSDTDWLGVVVEYPSTGSLTELKVDAGSGNKASWASVSWNEEILANTDIIFNVRTSDDNATWSDWSADLTTPGGSSLSSADPSRYLEIKVTLSSSDGLNTPTLNDFTVTYDTLEAPVNENIVLTKTDDSSLYTSSGTLVSGGIAGAYSNESSLRISATGLTCGGGDSGEPACEGTSTNIRPEVEVSNITDTDFSTPVFTGEAAQGSDYVDATGLTAGESYHIRVRAIDDEGRVSAWTNYVGDATAITIEQTPPTGTVVIDEGEYTKDATVNLNLSAADEGGSGLSQMRFSNSGAEGQWSDWETYATSKAWDITNATYGGNTNEEEKTVYVQYKDNAGNISGTWLQTSDEDFNAGTKDQISVSGDLYRLTMDWILGPVAGIEVYKEDQIGAAWQTSNTDCPAPQCNGSYLVDPFLNPEVDFSAYPAQNACKNIGGRLPTPGELGDIYTYKLDYGNNFTYHTSFYHWTNAETFLGSDAFFQYFSTGLTGARAKNQLHYSRCVRSEGTGSNEYSTTGVYTSSVKDNINFKNYSRLHWSANIPSETGADALRFQVASNNDNVTWNYVGPDGTAGTYYDADDNGIQIHSSHNGHRYIRYKAYLQTANSSYTPTVYDVGIEVLSINASILYDHTPPANTEATITYPTAGESLIGATEEEITWDDTKITDPGDNASGLLADGTTAITIQFTSDNGNNWSTVESGLPNSGSYTWTVPNNSTCVNQCRIAVLAQDKAGNENTPADANTTSALFSIIADSQAPQWDAGTVLDVSNTKYISGATTWTDATPTLSWTPAPTDPAPGSGIAEYEVIFEGATAETITGLTTTEATPTLAEGVHEWYVNAIDGAGLSANTKDELSRTKTISVDATAPNATLNIISLTGGAATNSCTVAINLADQVEVGSGISSIQYSNDELIWSSLGEGSTWDLCSASSTKGTKTVYARLIDNVANQRTISSTILYEDTLPTNPSAVTATLVPPGDVPSTYVDDAWVGNSSISIEWSGEIDPEPNSSGVASYVVYRSTDNGAYTEVSADSASPYVDTGLVDGHNYKYIIKVIDDAGNSSLYQTNPVIGELNVADITSPEPPENFNASGTDSTTIDVTWNSAPENSISHSGKADSYTIERTADSALGSSEPTNDDTCNTYTYSDTIQSPITFEQGGVYDPGNDKYTITDTVNAEEWYYYRIKAIDERPSDSDYTCFKARGNFAPEFPQENINLSADTVVPGDEVTITFTATDFDGATDLDTGNAIQQLKIQDGALAEVLAYTEVTEKEAYNDGARYGYTYTYGYTVPETAKYGTYTVTINVADSVAVGSPGDNFHNQTKQVQFKVPPAAPTSLSATGYTSTSVNLTWTAPGNAGNQAGLRGTNPYSVKRRSYGSSDPFVHLAYSNATSYTNSGLALGTAYEYQVVAFDINGNEGPASNNSNAIPPAPATPASATVRDASHTSIDLGGTYPLRYFVTWDAVTESSVPDFKGYKVYRSTDGGEYTYLDTIDCDTLGENRTYYLDLHTAADEGTSYQYQVHTWDEAGNIGDGVTTLATDASVTPTVTTPTLDSKGVSWIKVKWTTDQEAYSLVEYKKADASSYSIAGQKSIITEKTGDSYQHTVTIRGLEKNQDYNIRVKSVNQSNIMSASSNEITVKTENFAISDVKKDIKASSATISWNTGSVPSNAIVIYNKIGSGAQSDTSDNPPKETMKTSHSVEISNLTPGDYSFYVKSYDAEGNLAEAGNTNLYTFTITGFDTGTLSDPKAGKIEEQDITATSAKITWTSTVSTSSWVDYGTTSGNYGKSTGSDTLTIDHIVTLEGLTPGQTYYYIVRGLDANGTEYKSQEYSFVALARPSISNVEVLEVTSYTARIRVEVTKETEASITYGINGAFNEKAGGGSLARVHDIELTNLTDKSNYSFYVDVKDSAGNTAKSETKTFKTPLDTTGPTISSVKIDLLPIGESDEYAQAIISWTTDKPATTLVMYDEGVIGGEYGSSSIEDTSLNTAHTVIVKELLPSTTYRFQLVSKDKRGNESKSADYNFVTPSREKSILQLILKSLEETFSWVRNVGGFFRNIGEKF
ncbi:MAG: fibronectin type III domain-containing protein [Patescibacteria group bacterium]|nr:fibronectin type III domain-containing protein [Patescibacteria group bacterium]